MLRKVFISVCIIAVLGSGCNQTTVTPIAAVQPLATNTSTSRPTPTKTSIPRSTVMLVGDPTLQAPSRLEFHTRTPSRTPTPTRTFTHTPTPKPVPPLIAHEWTTEPILLRFGQIGGDGADPLDYSLPSLILYSDGRLIFRQWEKSNEDDLPVKLWEVVLNRQEMCALLNTIDQTGFLDYDPSTYLPEGQYLPFDGASDTVIEVNSWRSKQVSLNGLWVFLNGEPSMAGAIVFGDPDYGTLPYIPGALRNTYRLLTHYKPKNVHLYQPRRLALRIEQMDEWSSFGDIWPLTSPTLSDLYKRSSSGQDIVITTGAETTAIYQVFGNSMGAKVFDENTHRYIVAARPLLPYERLGSDYAFSSVNAPTEFKRPMSCEPSDGTLAIP